MLVAAVLITVTRLATGPNVDASSAMPESASDEFSTSVEEGWPSLFGPRGDSISRERHVAAEWPASGPAPLWSVPIGTGYSSPIALENLVYAFHRQGDEEIVEAFDIVTGASVWRFVYPTSYRCPYDYSHGPYSTPTIDGPHLFAYGAEGKLHCLDRLTGKLVWQRWLNQDYETPPGLFAAACSPLFVDDQVILNVGGGKKLAGIVAVDRANGETLWTATNHGAGYATPRAATIHGRKFVFCITDEYLVALDPEDGRVFWEIPFRSKSPDACNATSPLVVDDLVLITTGPGYGSLCLRILPDATYQEVWRDRRVLDSTWNNLVHHQGYVYGFSSKRIRSALRCVELASGKLMWSHESELERGASLAVGGRLIVLGEHGHLGSFALSPQRGQVHAMTAEPILKRPCYSAPALHRGRLIVRNEQSLLCLDLRGPSTHEALVSLKK